MRSKTKPTPGEIERAQQRVDSWNLQLRDCMRQLMVAEFAQALAVARERCAVWHEKQRDSALAARKRALELHDAVNADHWFRCAETHHESAAAIRRGEP